MTEEGDPPDAFDARTFFEAVWDLVRAVPPGRVTTYGWLARRLGRPQHARLVGYALHGALAGGGVPCHRVVNSAGRLSGAPHFGPPGQRVLLEAEGVTFRPEGGIDLRRYLWRPDEPAVEPAIEPGMTTADRSYVGIVARRRPGRGAADRRGPAVGAWNVPPARDDACGGG